MMIKKQIIEMEYSELEELVKKVYGIEWSLVADQELGNDSSYSVEISKEEIDGYEIGRLEAWKKGKFVGWLAPWIMTDLCNNGHLEPGDYLIQISW